ncbi:PREDICTED: adhesin Ata autotransporter-like, partial [Habropoda laboriosa]|uniref:adhesin Ata autotransporter-like n=1 Tax=Habropoda laboriosa TaxID=597456 RepID=UPI00083DB395
TNNIVASSDGKTKTTTTAGNTAYTDGTNNVSVGNSGLSVNDGTNTSKVTATGLTVNNGPSVTTTGIDAAKMKVTNVADGDVNSTSKDAINGSQLYATQQSGLNFKDNNGTVTHKNLGETLTIKGTGTKADDQYNTANIKTTTDSSGNVVVGIDQNSNFQTVTATDTNGNNSVLSGTGTAVKSSDGKTTANYDLTESKLTDSSGNTNTSTATNNIIASSDGNTKTTTTAGNTAYTDGTNNVSVGNSGLSASNGSNSSTVTATNGLNVTDGTNTSKVTATGLTVNNGPSVTTTGIDAAKMKVTNVADGDVNSTSKDAINGSQLYATQQSGLNFKDNNGTVTHKNLGETLTIKGTGTKADDQYNTANIKTTTDSSGNVVVGIDQNSNFQTVTATDTNGNNSVLSGTGTAVKSSDGKTTANYDLTESKLTDSSGNTNTSTATNNIIASSDGNTKTTTTAGNTAYTDGTNNVSVGNSGLSASNGSNSSTVTATNGLNVTDGTNTSKVTATGLTVNNGPSVTTTGIDAAKMKVTNVADGDVNSTSKDAINGSQLYATQQSGLNFKDNNGTVTHKNLGETLTIKGTGTKADDQYNTANIKTTTDSSGNVVVGIDQNSNFQTVTATDTNGNNSVLSGTGTAVKSSDGKTTANYDLTESKLTDSSGNTNTSTATNNIIASSDGNTKTTTTAGNTAYTDGTNNVSVGNSGLSASNGSNSSTVTATNGLNVTDGTNTSKVTATGLTVNNGPSVTTTGIDAAKMKVTNVADGDVNSTSKDAINGSQLYATQQSGLNFKDNNGTVTHKNLGETLTIKGTGTKADDQYNTANIKTTTDSSGNVVVGIDQNSNFQTVTATDTNGNNSVLSGTGTAVKSSDGKTTANYDLTESKLTDSSGNTNTSTATNNIIASSDGNTKTTTTAGNTAYTDGTNNVSVGNSGLSASNGSNSSTVTATNGLNVTDGTNTSKVTATGLTVNNGPSVTTTGIDAAKMKVTNVADGDVNSTSKDAINGSQLYATQQSGLNFKDNNGTVTHKNLGETLTIKGTGTKADDQYNTANIKTTTDSSGNVVVGIDQNSNFQTVTATDTNGNNSVLSGTGTAVKSSDGKTTANYDLTESKLTDSSGNTNTSTATNNIIASSDGNTKTTTTAGNTAYTDGTNNVSVGNSGLSASNGSNSSTVTATNGLNVTDGTNTSKVTATGLTVNNGPSVTTTGIDAAKMKVTNVADGDVNSTSKDAINGSQLYATQQSGLNFKDNNGTVTHKNLGETLTIKGTGTKADDQYNTANIKTTTDSSGTGTAVKSSDGKTTANYGLNQAKLTDSSGNTNTSTATNNIVASSDGKTKTTTTAGNTAYTDGTNNVSVGNSGLSVNDGTNTSKVTATGLTVNNGPSVTTT